MTDGYIVINSVFVSYLFLCGYISIYSFCKNFVLSLFLAPTFGLSLYVAIGFVYALSGVISVIALLATLLAVSVALLLRGCMRERAWRWPGLTGLPGLGWGLVIAVAIALLFMGLAGLLFNTTTIHHVDSFQYIIVVRHMEAGTFWEWGNTHQMWRRQLAVGLLHIPAALVDQLYLVSIQLYIAIATIMLASFSIISERARIGQTFTYLAMIFLVVALVVSNRFLMHATYLNGHLLTALYMLTVIVAAFPVFRSSRENLRLACLLQSVAVVALVVTRMEGAFLALLVLIPVLLTKELPAAYRAVPLSALGAAIIVWNGFVWIAHRLDGLSVSAFVYIYILIGVGLILSALLLIYFNRIIDSFSKILVYSASAVFVVVAYALNAESFGASFEASISNINRDWGYGLYMYGVTVLFCIIFSKNYVVAILKYPVVMYVPFMFVMAVVRDNPFRDAPADSFNRALISIFPLAILLIAIAAASRQWGWPWTRVSPLAGAQGGQAR